MVYAELFKNEDAMLAELWLRALLLKFVEL
jgi:hypothetical protein